MAKVIGPLKLSGTLGGITFSDTTEGNIAKEKREDYMTSEEFMANPVYDRIREHGKEMGYCSIKSRLFRQLAVNFFKNSKDVSFAGRANQILFEILEEDLLNPKGARTLLEGIKSPFLGEIILGFEGNKNRPLAKVLKTNYVHSPEKNTIKITDCIPQNHLDWPEGATHAHFAMATSNWDFENNTFDTCYSDEIIVDKEAESQTIDLSTEKPKGNQLQLTYLYIGFAKKERRKYKPFHRRSNTVSIIAYHYPSTIPSEIEPTC
jgi:hypothetical protein